MLEHSVLRQYLKSLSSFGMVCLLPASNLKCKRFDRTLAPFNKLNRLRYHCNCTLLTISKPFSLNPFGSNRRDARLLSATGDCGIEESRRVRPVGGEAGESTAHFKAASFAKCMASRCLIDEGPIKQRDLAKEASRLPTSGP
jgi:hypothetical protein